MKRIGLEHHCTQVKRNDDPKGKGSGKKGKEAG